MRATAHPVPTWSYCEAEMGGMECQDLQAETEEMERQEHPAPKDPLAPLLLILVCRALLGPLDQRDPLALQEQMDLLDPLEPTETPALLGPQEQRDPLALLDLKVSKAHLDPLAPLDPLDLRGEPLALAGLFMYAGDEPPVLAHLEQSWCTQEGLEGVIIHTAVEEQTNSVYQMFHST